ncbi:hypothetical protein HYQ46_007521 [Verticillium longisporum]|nr:hypothetical protein HYQ46_007521 [Verticillium longisporum]
MFRCDKVDVVNASHILQLQIPLAQLFGCQVLAVSLVCDIVVLTEDTSQVTSRKEDSTAAVVSLDAGF